MTTLQPPPTATTRPAVRPRVVARGGLYAVLAANAVVVTVFFVQAGFASNTLIVLGRLAGLYGALLMAFQLLLVARLPWFDRRIGMDRLTSWHRWTGFCVLWLLVAHAVFIAGGPWRVGVRHPEHADRLCAVVELRDGAVATSARYERGDHIIDGRMGRPATGLLSMTVVAPTLTEADTVATAAFALGAEGVDWAAARENCEVFAVDAGRRVLRTAGFPVAGAVAA